MAETKTDYLPSNWILDNQSTKLKPKSKSKSKRRGINLQQNTYTKFRKIKEHFNMASWSDLVEVLYDIHILKVRREQL